MKRFIYLYPMNTFFILWTACFLEIITYIFRFGFNMHSRNMQKRFKFPLRIHHMYLGLILVIPGFFYGSALFPDFILGGPSITLIDIGLAIALSDVFHHFAILPLFHQQMDFP